MAYKNWKLGVFYSFFLIALWGVTPAITPKADADYEENEIENCEEEGENKFFPSQWFNAQRAFPYEYVKPIAYQEAMQSALQLRNNSLNTRGIIAWQLAGPTNAGGRVTSIAIHSSNTQTMYVGAAAGGVFKTINGGTTWTSIFDNTLSLAIGDLAIAPSNPNILYVGTGEANGGGGSTNYDGVGVYKTLDAGATWKHLGPTDIGSIGKIVIDAKNPNRVFVAAMGYLYVNSSKRGVYRTQDGGSTWQKVLYLTDSTGGIDLAIHPTQPDTVYAAMWERSRTPYLRDYGGPTCGLFRSINGGTTWIKMIKGLPTSNIGRIGISISQGNPSVLYALYADETGNYAGTYRSNDNGENWTVLDANKQLQFMYSGFGWWFGKIFADPVDANIVYALGLDVYRSTDGGQNWLTVSNTNHVDNHAFWINPSNNTEIYNGNDGGFYGSKTNGSTWTYYNNIPNTQFYACEIDEKNPQRLYGGTQDNGTWRTLDGNINFWQYILGGDGFYALVDPIDNKYVYAESQNGNLARSVDGGATFGYALQGVNASDRHNWNSPLVFAPDNPATLYFGTNRLYRSTDRALSWTPISSDLSNGKLNIANVSYGTITTIDVSPKNPQIIYAGTDDGNVWVTSDGGINWTKISQSFVQRWITRVTADPFDANTAYVALSGFRWNEYQPHIYKTTNLGATWVDISTTLPQSPVNDILADPSERGTLYAATDVGVYTSRSDDATKWEVLGTGLPLSPVVDLRLHKPSRKLVAATYGRSMYTYNLPQATSANDISNHITDFVLSPNPLTSVATLSFNLTKGNSISIDIFDLSGRLIKNVHQEKMSAGNHQILIARSDFKAAGVYVCRLQVGNAVHTTKFFVL
jgi:photosystem II stability/assembly factor-like uncharacterized protein